MKITNIRLETDEMKIERLFKEKEKKSINIRQRYKMRNDIFINYNPIIIL